MKKKLKIIIFTFIIIIVIIWRFASRNHHIKYTIKSNSNLFQINEKYKRKVEKQKDIYHIKIKKDNVSFIYQFHYPFHRKKKVVKKIKYYQDEKDQCILPIFEDNKVLTDILCYRNGNYYYYHHIIGQNKALDQFVKNIKEYDFKEFDDPLKKQKTIQNLTLYQNINLISDQIVIENYKGIYIVHNQKIKNIQLFSNDIYKKNIKSLNGKYYIIADYNQKYEFHNFYKIDITTKKISKIISNEAISLDSYVQGNKDDDVYLFDINNQNQYQINIVNSTVTKIHTKTDQIKHLELNKWKKINSYHAKKTKIYFNYYIVKNNDQLRIDKIGNQEYGYYYYYKKEKGKYYVYRSDQSNQKTKHFLFELDNIDRIKYKDNRIYYIDDNALKMYSDFTGIKTILKDNEFRFNKNLDFYIY